MYQDLYCYIDLDWELYVQSKQDYLKEIFQIIQIVYQHKLSVYYSQEQLIEFQNNCTDLYDDFAQSDADLLGLILVNALQRKKEGDCFEVCYAGKNTSLNAINNQVISSIGNHEKIALLTSQHFTSNRTLLSIKSNTEFHKVYFKEINTVQNFLDWLRENRVERVFNKSKKHGERGIGNWEDASPLLCTFREAQLFLDVAIPDFNAFSNKLFFFDDNNDTFIEFYYEGNIPQNIWHGFHTPKKSWRSRIPQTILKYFGKS